MEGLEDARVEVEAVVVALLGDAIEPVDLITRFPRWRDVGRLDGRRLNVPAAGLELRGPLERRAEPAEFGLRLIRCGLEDLGPLL